MLARGFLWRIAGASSQSVALLSLSASDSRTRLGQYLYIAAILAECNSYVKREIRDQVDKSPNKIRFPVWIFPFYL